VGWEWDKIGRLRIATVRPPGVALFLAIFVALGVVYSVVNPLFEAPDEIQHFFYVQQLAEGGGLPRQDLARGAALWGQEGSQPPLYYALAALLIAPLDTSDAPALVWENVHANMGNPLRLDNKNRIVHTDQEAWPYRDAVLAVHLVRWFSVLLGACTVWLVYRITLELIPEPPRIALATAALTAFTPQFIFISSAVSNDNLITCLAALVTWVLLRGRRASRSGRWLLGLGLTLGLAALCKLSGLALWLLVGGVILTADWRRRPLRRTMADLVVVFAVAAAVAGWWYWRNWRLYGDVTGLNRMLEMVGRQEPGMTWRSLLSQFQGLRISYWSLFGWFNLPLPEWIYRALDGFTVLAVLGLILDAARHLCKHTLIRLRWLLLPLAWIAVMLISLARWTSLTPGMQGRLLFPAIWAITVILIWGWSRWLDAHTLGAQPGMTVAWLGQRPVRAAGWSRWLSGRWRSLWLALPIVPLAMVAVIVPFAVIRPAYQKPPLIAPDAVPLAARLPVVQHGDQVACNGGMIEPDTAHPGDTVWVTVYWQVLAPFERDYTVFVHFTDHAGRGVAEAGSWPGSGSYPTRLWQPGTVIVDRYPVRIPGGAAAPSLLRADVGFFIWPDEQLLPSFAPNGDATPSVVGRLRLLPGRTKRPEPAHRLDVRLDEAVRLLGYDLSPTGPVASGADLTVTLYWEATSRLVEDYTVFVHLRGPDGANLAQGDGQPLAGAWPTSAWEPGQPVTDRHTVTLPISTAAGAYGLWVGLYRLADLSRLPVAGPSDQVRDDAIFLGEVVVTDEAVPEK